MIPVGPRKIVVACVLSLFFTAALSACGTAPPGNTENGEKWYKMNNCSACHGEKGNGGGRGPDITGMDMGFASFVKKLRKKDAPIMPPFPESKISEQDAADIYAYLKKAK